MKLPPGGTLRQWNVVLILHAIDAKQPIQQKWDLAPGGRGRVRDGDLRFRRQTLVSRYDVHPWLSASLSRGQQQRQCRWPKSQNMEEGRRRLQVLPFDTVLVV